MIIGQALSSFEKVREGAIDGANCGEFLGYDFCAKQKFETKYEKIRQGDRANEEYCAEWEDEDDEEDSLNKKRKREESVPLLNELRKLDSVSPFAIGGHSKLFLSDFHLQMSPIVGKSNDFVDLGSVRSLNVESVQKYCDNTTASSTNEIHTSMFACYSDRFKIVDEKPIDTIYRYKVDFMAEISHAVNSNLLQHLKYSEISLVPNKLNIYSEIGHFKPHIDTPTHDPALFIGTVVVCLPSEHTGGNLIVRHAGKEVNFDFAAQSNNPYIVQFAAFYGDCEHEVLPVTSGHCLMLTYSILRSKDVPYRRGVMWDNYGRPTHNVVNVTVKSELHDLTTVPTILSAVRQELQAALQRSPFVGVFLSHAYTHTGLTTAANLKGADKLLYDLLTDTMQLPVSLTPVVTRTIYKIHDEEYYGHRFRCDDVKPDCEVRMLRGFPDNRLPEHKNISSNVAKDVAFLSAGKVKGVEIRNMYEAGQYNESTDIDPTIVDKIYINGAMIIGPLSVDDTKEN